MSYKPRDLSHLNSEYESEISATRAIEQGRSKVQENNVTPAVNMDETSPAEGFSPSDQKVPDIANLLQGLIDSAGAPAQNAKPSRINIDSPGKSGSVAKPSYRPFVAAPKTGIQNLDSQRPIDKNRHSSVQIAGERRFDQPISQSNVPYGGPNYAQRKAQQEQNRRQAAAQANKARQDSYRNQIVSDDSKRRTQEDMDDFLNEYASVMNDENEPRRQRRQRRRDENEAAAAPSRTPRDGFEGFFDEVTGDIPEDERYQSYTGYGNQEDFGNMFAGTDMATLPLSAKQFIYEQKLMYEHQAQLAQQEYDRSRAEAFARAEEESRLLRAEQARIRAEQIEREERLRASEIEMQQRMQQQALMYQNQLQAAAEANGKEIERLRNECQQLRQSLSAATAPVEPAIPNATIAPDDLFEPFEQNEATAPAEESAQEEIVQEIVAEEESNPFLEEVEKLSKEEKRRQKDAEKEAKRAAKEAKKAAKAERKAAKKANALEDELLFDESIDEVESQTSQTEQMPEIQEPIDEVPAEETEATADEIAEEVEVSEVVIDENGNLIEEATSTSLVEESNPRKYSHFRAFCRFVLSIVLVLNICLLAASSLVDPVLKLNTAQKSNFGNQYYFTAREDVSDTPIKNGDFVIVNTNQSVENGEVFAFVDWANQNYGFAKKNGAIIGSNGIYYRGGNGEEIDKKSIIGGVGSNIPVVGKYIQFVSDNKIVSISALSALAVILFIVIAFLLKDKSGRRKNKNKQKREQKQQIKEDRLAQKEAKAELKAQKAADKLAKKQAKAEDEQIEENSVLEDEPLQDDNDQFEDYQQDDDKIEAYSTDASEEVYEEVAEEVLSSEDYEPVDEIPTEFDEESGYDFDFLTNPEDVDFSDNSVEFEDNNDIFDDFVQDEAEDASQEVDFSNFEDVSSDSGASEEEQPPYQSDDDTFFGDDGSVFGGFDEISEEPVEKKKKQGRKKKKKQKHSKEESAISSDDAQNDADDSFEDVFGSL